MQQERDLRNRPRTVGEYLQQWLAEHVSAEHAPLVDECIGDFFVEAAGILDFPPALGINQGTKPRSLRLELLWPAFLPASQRYHHEGELRDIFERVLVTPVAPIVSCELAFAEHLPQRAKDYGAYFGPTPQDYEAFAQWMLEGKRAVDQHPQVAQQMKDLIDTLPGKSEDQKRELLQQICELAARLHAA